MREQTEGQDQENAHRWDRGITASDATCEATDGFENRNADDNRSCLAG